jgi:hypothetical protein
MQPDEMAIFFTLVVSALMIFAMLVSAYKRRLDFKMKKLELEASARTAGAEPAPSRRDDRTDLLEDRVRVLERIATDRGQDIAHQIEALRGREERI